jgi:hypothetical protein
MQLSSKHVSVAMNKHATTENPWKRHFLCSPCRGYTPRTNRLSRELALVVSCYPRAEDSPVLEAAI